MRTFDLLVAAFALLQLLRGEGPRAMGIVSALNVVLAVAILAVAVKGLARVLISR